MPLTKLQSNILGLLAKQRSPDSYVAGGVAINRDGPRYSGDIDIFHDGDARLALTVDADISILRSSGLVVSLVGRQGTGKRSANIAGLDESTKIDWVADSDFRFFPTLTDELFGYVLHPVDLATNKVSAAADRRVPRDVVDLLTLHETILPLGAAITASVGKFIGESPEGIFDSIRRHSRFTAPEFAELPAIHAFDVKGLQRRIVVMLEDAERFILAMPSDGLGVLFLNDGKPVQPDPSRLGDYTRHEGARRGHWPSSSEIGSAMLERYTPDKDPA